MLYEVITPGSAGGNPPPHLALSRLGRYLVGRPTVESQGIVEEERRAIAQPTVLEHLLAEVGPVLRVVVGLRILQPLAQEARWLNLPTRFTLSDFVWLLVLLQIVLAAVLAVAPPDVVV